MSEEPKNPYANWGPEDLERAVEENRKICQPDDNPVKLWDGTAWYQIEFSECDTHEKLTRWTFHLTEKAWVTTKHIRLLLAEVFCRYPALAPKY